MMIREMLRPVCLSLLLAAAFSTTTIVGAPRQAEAGILGGALGGAVIGGLIGGKKGARTGAIVGGIAGAIRR